MELKVINILPKKLTQTKIDDNDQVYIIEYISKSRRVASHIFVNDDNDKKFINKTSHIFVNDDNDKKFINKIRDMIGGNKYIDVISIFTEEKDGGTSSIIKPLWLLGKFDETKYKTRIQDLNNSIEQYFQRELKSKFEPGISTKEFEKAVLSLIKASGLIDEFLEKFDSAYWIMKDGLEKKQWLWEHAKDFLLKWSSAFGKVFTEPQIYLSQNDFQNGNLKELAGLSRVISVKRTIFYKMANNGFFEKMDLNDFSTSIFKFKLKESFDEVDMVKIVHLKTEIENNGYKIDIDFGVPIDGKQNISIEQNLEVLIEKTWQKNTFFKRKIINEIIEKKFEASVSNEVNQFECSKDDWNLKYVFIHRDCDSKDVIYAKLPHKFTSTLTKKLKKENLINDAESDLLHINGYNVWLMLPRHFFESEVSA